MNSSKNMLKPLVSVIIVNWNGQQLLDDCLRSLTKSTYKNLEIFFVDNASRDDSVDHVKNNFKSVKIIQNTENLGYAEGHERAFKQSKGEFVLLLSTDTIINPNVVETLVKVMVTDKNLGAVMPKLLMYPKKHLIDSLGAFFLMNGDLYHFGREKDPKGSKYNKQMYILSVKGACTLFRKKALEKTGMFDKDYFAYFEETDLSMRTWLAGYKLLYVPEATVYHKGGVTSAKLQHSYILFHSYKNRIYTYLKNLSLKYLLIVLPQIFLIYQGVFLLYLCKFQFGYALAVQRGLLWNVTNFSHILKKRKFVQEKIRKISDDDYLPLVTKPVRLSYYYYQFFGGIEKYKD